MQKQIAKVLNEKAKELGKTIYRIKEETGVHYPAIKSMLGEIESSYIIRDLSKVLKCLEIKELVLDGVTIIID